jgi:V8-like Glu-specific endopeptidase
MKPLAAAAAAAALVACGVAAPASLVRAERIEPAMLPPLPRSEAPLRYASTFKGSAWRRAFTGNDACAAAVGLVETSSVGRSTGFLVGGQHRVVLTTAHGLVDKETGRPLRRANVRFDNSRDGRIATGATVAAVGATADFATTNAARDWAVLLLDEPLPRVQSLTVRYARQPDELPRLGPSLALIAYHYDFMSGNAAAVSDRCSITHAAADGLVLHDCDAMVGSSGGPILHRQGALCTAVAINQGCLGRHARNLDYQPLGNDANANRAVPLANLRETLEQVLRRVEAADRPQVPHERSVPPFP